MEIIDKIDRLYDKIQQQSLLKKKKWPKSHFVANQRKVVFNLEAREIFIKIDKTKILQTSAYQKEMTMSRQSQLQHLLQGFFPQSKPIRSDSNPQLLLQFLNVVPQRPRKQETPERIHPLLKKALEHKTKTSIMADQLIGQTRRCKTYNEIAEEEQMKKNQKLRDDLLNKRGRNQLSKKPKKRRQPRTKRDSTRNSDDSEQKGYGPPYKVTILTKQQLYSELDKRKNDKSRIHAGSRSRSKHARKIVKEIVENKKRFADKSREQKLRNVQPQSKDSSMTVVQTNPLQKLKDEKPYQHPALPEEQKYHDHLFGKPKQVPSQNQQDTQKQQAQYNYPSYLPTTLQTVRKKQIDSQPAYQPAKSNQNSFSRQLTQVLNPKIIPNHQQRSQKDRLLEQKRKLAQQNERLEKLLQNIQQTENNKKIQDRKQLQKTKVQQRELPQKKYTPPTEDRSQSRSSLSNKQQHYNRNHRHSKSNKYRDQSPRSPKKDHKHNYRNYRQQPYGKHERDHRRNSSSSKRDYSPAYNNNYQPEPDWRKELREVTHYNPHDRKYRERDRMTIQESNFRRINKQEAFSRKMGQIEEQKQLLREKSNRRKY